MFGFICLLVSVLRLRETKNMKGEKDRGNCFMGLLCFVLLIMLFVDFVIERIFDVNVLSFLW